MTNKLVDILIEKGYTISCAESCTGGMLASKIVDVPDASKVFNVSFVTYANEAKIKYLGVLSKTIAKYGAVSEEVAKKMAVGVAKKASSNVGVGISGIAGPGGGSAEKPIGMVCFGFVINDKVTTYTKYFGGIGRNEVRSLAVSFVINTLIEMLK